MGTQEPTPIRLRVPARAEYVAVLRVAARAVAGRAGCDDDGRSRFQAAAGRAFFAAIDGARDDDQVHVSLRVDQDRVQAEVIGPPGSRARLRALTELADGHDAVDGDGGLRFWIDR